MTDAHAKSNATHLAPMKATRPYLERMLTAVSSGLAQIRNNHNLRSIELMVGFAGRKVAPVLIQNDAFSCTARCSEANFDDLLETGSWSPLPALFDDESESSEKVKIKLEPGTLQARLQRVMG